MLERIKKDLDNNIFILKCVKESGKIAFFILVFNIIVETIAYFIGTNIGMWVFDAIAIKTMKSSIIFVASIYLFMLVLRFVSGWLNMYTFPIANIKVTEYLMKTIIKKTFDIRQKEVENPVFFDKYSRAISEISTRPGEVLGMLRDFFGGILQLVTMIAVVSNLSIKYTFIFMTASIVNTVLTIVTNETDYKKYMESTKINRKLSYVNRVVYQPEYGRFLRNNVGFCPMLTGYYVDETQNLKNVIYKYHKKLYLLNVINDLFSVVCFGVGPWILAIIELTNNTMTIGQVTVVMGATTFFPTICTKLFGSIVSIRKHGMYIDNLRDVLDYDQVRNANKSLPKDETEFVLETHNLSFSYNGRNQLTLKNVCLQIKQGEKVAFVGPNGAGKTTLASILSGLYSANEGFVYLKGVDIDKVSLNTIHDEIIMINQDTCMLSFSIAENILQRPLTSLEDYKIVEEALEKVGMLEKVKTFKNGLDTFISREFDDDGVVFSGGEMQKLAIARIYVSTANIVIMDEPTSALDAISEQEIIDLLFELLGNRTLIMISHRLSFANMVDSIFYIDQGDVIERGSHKELMEKQGRYYKLYSTQSVRYGSGS